MLELAITLELGIPLLAIPHVAVCRVPDGDYTTGGQALNYLYCTLRVYSSIPSSIFVKTYIPGKILFARLSNASPFTAPPT